MDEYGSIFNETIGFVYIFHQNFKYIYNLLLNTIF